MKRYSHWLKFPATFDRDSKTIGLKNVLDYKNNNPDCEIEMYLSTVNLFSFFVLLRCGQNYKELDIDCNSGFKGSLEKKFYKPQNIEKAKWSFEDYCKRFGLAQ